MAGNKKLKQLGGQKRFLQVMCVFNWIGCKKSLAIWLGEQQTLAKIKLGEKKNHLE